mmetsp:Transcript_12575/g.44020  ORF Transcript_12575/g.44020 Transcript_12575/m.44020 type:complete len:263 (-) Transcript_12575:36-824(-)
MADAAPDAPVLARQLSSEEHAKVFDGLLTARIESAQKAMVAMTEGAPEEVMKQAAEMAELQMRASGGDEEAKEALQSYAERYQSDMSKELEAVWAEYDRDGDGSLSPSENRTLVKAFLQKEHENVIPTLRSTLEQGMMMGMNVGIAAAEETGEEAPDTNQFMDFVTRMLDAVFDEIKPAIDEIFEAMIADSDRLADEMFSGMDTNEDGRVSKDEFTSKFLKVSSSIINQGAIQERLQAQVQQVLMRQMAEGGGPDGEECSIM